MSIYVPNNSRRREERRKNILQRIKQSEKNLIAIRRRIDRQPRNFRPTASAPTLTLGRTEWTEIELGQSIVFLLAATGFELADETQRERRPRKGNS